MKTFKIKVIPNSKINKIVELEDGSFKVKLTTQPEKGKANDSLIKLLTAHFKIPKNKIRIISGLRSQNKIVKIS